MSESAASLGATLGQQALGALAAQVVSLRRAGGAVVRPADDIRLAAGDTLVLSGRPEALALAEARLLEG